MRKESKVQLGIEEIVTLCYIVGASTNGICQFVSTLSALCPDLRIFSTCIRAKLVEFEGGSKRMYVKDKATVINTFMDSIMDTVSDHGKEMTYRVLSKVADDLDMVVETIQGPTRH